MKILTLIPVYRRPEITEICYRALWRLYADAPIGLEFQTLILASTGKDAKLAKQYGFDVRMVDNKPVATKLNKGLEYALSEYEFDYLFQINSDNVLHTGFWGYFSPFLLDDKPFFGCNHIAFYDSQTGRLLKYLYPGGCGIRFIRQYVVTGAATRIQVDNPEAVAGVGFVLHTGLQWVQLARYRTKYGEAIQTKIELWPPDRNSGLDDSSQAAIRQAFPNAEYMQKFPYQNPPEPLVIDIKSESNIHPFSEFEGDRMAVEVEGEEKERILECFPEIKMIEV